MINFYERNSKNLNNIKEGNCVNIYDVLFKFLVTEYKNASWVNNREQLSTTIESFLKTSNWVKIVSIGNDDNVKLLLLNMSSYIVLVLF